MKKILREKRLPRVKRMLNVYINSIAVYIKSDEDEEEESSWKFFFQLLSIDHCRIIPKAYNFYRRHVIITIVIIMHLLQDVRVRISFLFIERLKRKDELLRRWCYCSVQREVKWKTLQLRKNMHPTYCPRCFLEGTFFYCWCDPFHWKRRKCIKMNGVRGHRTYMLLCPSRFCVM